MKKRTLLVVLMLSVAMSLVIAVPASACENGCTPGYWKQPHHLDSWEATGYDPDQSVYSAFGVGPDDVTLLEALWLRGGGENAFLRHAVAALLNAAHPDVGYWTEDHILGIFENHPEWYGQEWLKDWFERWNEFDHCPLN
jgi:hypothetical protein